MKIKTAKIEALHLSRNPDQCVLQVNGVKLEQVEKFKYLGVAFTSDRRQDEELDTQISKACAVTLKMLNGEGILWLTQVCQVAWKYGKTSRYWQTGVIIVELCFLQLTIQELSKKAKLLIFKIAFVLILTYGYEP